MYARATFTASTSGKPDMKYPRKLIMSNFFAGNTRPVSDRDVYPSLSINDREHISPVEDNLLGASILHTFVGISRCDGFSLSVDRRLPAMIKAQPALNLKHFADRHAARSFILFARCKHCPPKA
jgi:hypothetical protein